MSEARCRKVKRTMRDGCSCKRCSSPPMRCPYREQPPRRQSTRGSLWPQLRTPDSQNLIVAHMNAAERGTLSGRQQSKLRAYGPPWCVFEPKVIHTLRPGAQKADAAGLIARA